MGAPEGSKWNFSRMRRQSGTSTGSPRAEHNKRPVSTCNAIVPDQRQLRARVFHPALRQIRGGGSGARPGDQQPGLADGDAARDEVHRAAAGICQPAAAPPGADMVEDAGAAEAVGLGERQAGKAVAAQHPILLQVGEGGIVEEIALRGRVGVHVGDGQLLAEAVQAEQEGLLEGGRLQPLVPAGGDDLEMVAGMGQQRQARGGQEQREEQRQDDVAAGAHATPG